MRALDDPRRYDGGDNPTGFVQSNRRSIVLELAELALILGDEQAARRELRSYVEGPDGDPSIMERVRARVKLRPLWDLFPDPEPTPAIAALTRGAVLAVLDRCGGVKEVAWRELGLRNRFQLNRVLKKLGVE